MSAMEHNRDRILTTHTGSLSRPPELISISRARATGKSADGAACAECLAAAVAEVMREQRDLGIDIVDDGEFGKPMADVH